MKHLDSICSRVAQDLLSQILTLSRMRGIICNLCGRKMSLAEIVLEQFDPAQEDSSRTKLLAERFQSMMEDSKTLFYEQTLSAISKIEEQPGLEKKREELSPGQKRQEEVNFENHQALFTTYGRDQLQQVALLLLALNYETYYPLYVELLLGSSS